MPASHLRNRSKDFMSKKWDLRQDSTTIHLGEHHPAGVDGTPSTFRHARLFNMAASSSPSISPSRGSRSPAWAFTTPSPWLGKDAGAVVSMLHRRSASMAIVSKSSSRRVKTWLALAVVAGLCIWSRSFDAPATFGTFSSPAAEAVFEASPVVSGAAFPPPLAPVVEQSTPLFIPIEEEGPSVKEALPAEASIFSKLPPQDHQAPSPSSSLIRPPTDAGANASAATSPIPSEQVEDRPVIDKSTKLVNRPAIAVSQDTPWVLEESTERLPHCQKTLLFQFTPWWGFASEWLLYLRAASLADKLGYTLVEDDRRWNYGRLSNYFLPRKLTCAPPRDWADARVATEIGRPGWKKQPRLVWSRLRIQHLDDWTRETYLDPIVMQKLHDTNVAYARNRSRNMLAEGDTMPQGLEEAFKDHVKAARFLWKLKDSIDTEVEAARTELEMGPHHITVATHIRLGDKGPEYELEAKAMGITNKFGNLTVYLQAAHEAMTRILPGGTPYTDEAPSPGGLDLESAHSPSLVVMTAEAHVMSRLAKDSLLRPFTLAQPPAPGIASLKHVAHHKTESDKPQVPDWFKDIQGKTPSTYEKRASIKDDAESTKESSPAKPEEGNKNPRPGLASGFSQSEFNRLPMLERVIHTRTFIRDLTLFSRDADAFIVSGSSNIGRLAMLIGGYEATVGPKDEEGRSLGGRIRSIDAHWFPTAYSEALYHTVIDQPQSAPMPAIPLADRRKGKGRLAKGNPPSSFARGNSQ
ncbi:BQ2448_4948 [Microbotryum intermedium]|uniref:BQ2448_4948 protein n=1 Tax=Microbotryum intermedium TaxID=269621 RepID=A0A238FK44_9BASI|nr:BQ2448_4948 [Microbotryum intermedium]